MRRTVQKTIRRVTSRHNPIVARYRATARGDTPGSMLLDGAHLIAEALATGTRIQHAAVATEALERTDIHELVHEPRNRGVDVDTAAPSGIDDLIPRRLSSPLDGLCSLPS